MTCTSQGTYIKMMIVTDFNNSKQRNTWSPCRLDNFAMRWNVPNKRPHNTLFSNEKFRVVIICFVLISLWFH